MLKIERFESNDETTSKLKCEIMGEQVRDVFEAQFVEVHAIYCIFQTFVYLHVHLEGCVSKPPLLCGVVRTDSQQRSFKPAFLYKNVAM